MSHSHPFDGERQWKVPKRTESTLIGQLLVNRNVTNQEQFFHPVYERDSYDPGLLPMIDIAVARIVRAIKQHETIAVYADYDADGIPGGAILMKLLRANGADPISYIPDRDREGYGLNDIAIAYLKAKDVRLIITVDLGITNHQAVSTAATSGIDVIVTDHHSIDPARIPTDAVATVHPALPGSAYPFSGLAGGGVAWKLAQAVALATGRPTENELKWWLELPAISTVCDLVPLRDENRMIVSFGLTVLRQSRSTGLRALYTAARIDPAVITERTIGFQIGPRINAPGRMDHASPAMELLLTEDTGRAAQLATQIELQNQNRQLLVARVIDEAMGAIVKLPELPGVIVLANPSWPVGVLGLVASRLVDRYHRPVILLNIDADRRAKGSARSIEGFNVLEAITSQRDLLTSFGGHHGAAGLSLDQAALEEFSRAMSEFSAARLTPELLRRVYRADVEITPEELTEALVNEVAAFAPFGVGNPAPRFVVRPVVVRSVRRLGADLQHLKLTFTGWPVSALAWRFTERSLGLPAVGQSIELLGQPEWNEWNGQRTLQFVIDDWRPANT